MGIYWQDKRSERALHNLLQRDAMFTRRLDDEAKHLEMNIAYVDTPMTVDDLTSRVTEVFEL